MASPPDATPAAPGKTPAGTAPAKRRRWSWWKRLLAGAGIFFLLLVVFYQPIIFGVIRLVAPGLAAKQNLRIDSLQLGGTIFTSLRVENLRVSPTKPGPIEKANVGRLELHYSLLTLARHGLNSAFIESVTLHDADIVYDPSKSPPPKPKKKEPFSLPPLPLPGKLSVRNVNFLMRPDSPEGARASGQSAAASPIVPIPASPAVAAATEAATGKGLLVSKLTLELDPDHNGEFRVAELRIPGGIDLTNVSAATSYHNRDLRLTDLALAPELHFRLLEIDGSKLEQQHLAVALDADNLFQGTANAAINLQGIGTPPRANVKLDAAGISLPSILGFLKLDLPLTGALDKLAVRFDGATDQPKSWTGGVDMGVGKIAYGDATTAPIDAANLHLTLDHGALELTEAGVAQGENHMGMRAHIDLAEKMADLPRSNGHGTLEINAPDFNKLPVKLPMEIDGSLHAGGDFTLANGKLSTTLKGHVAKLAIPAQKVAVTSMDFALDSAKVLPEDATAAPTAPGAPPPPHLPFYDRLQTRVSTVIDGVSYADYRIDGVKLGLSSDQANVKLDQLEITRGPNRVNADGTFVIPEDFAAWQKQPLDVHLGIALPDVSQFSADPTALPLKGVFNARGNVTSRGGVYGGGLDLQARDIQAKGATVQTADVVVAIADNKAVVQTGRIVLDDKNAVDLSGNAGLQAPYPFEGGLVLDLADLSRFNDVLKANGTDLPLAGSFKVEGRIGGHLATAPDANDQKIDGNLTVTARNLQAKGAKIESIDTQVVVENNKATIKTGQIKLDAKSGVTFGGNADLVSPYTYQGNLNVDVPDIGIFAALLGTPAPTTTAANVPAKDKDKEKVGGSFHLAANASGHLATKPGANDQELNGTVDIDGKDIQAKGAKIERIDGHIVAANQLVLIKTLQVHLDDKNTVNIDGQASVAAPFAYQLGLDINLPDLARFAPFLNTPDNQTQITRAKMEAASGAKTPVPTQINAPGHPKSRDAVIVPDAVTRTSAGKVAVAVKGTPGTPAMRAEIVKPAPPRLGGSFTMQWQAKGDFDKAADGPHFSGGGKLAAHQVVFNDLGPLEADIQGSYSQLVIDFPVIFVGTNGFEFRSTVALRDALARIDNIHLKQGATELLAGYIQIPLDLTKLSAPGGPIPDVDKIDVNVASKALPIAQLLTSASTNKAKPSPVDGTVLLEIQAHGSLSKITAGIKVEARAIRSTQLSTVRPADLDLKLSLQNNRLDLDTILRQPQIQPLTIKGNLPLDLHDLAEKKSLDPNSPVTLSIQLPRSSLGFLAGATKAIRFIQGDAAVDVRVGGTVGKPTFAGSLDLNIPAARADNITVPAVRDFHARLAFTEKELRFERFNGEIGGGKLNLGGRIGFATLSEPTLDLTATARDILAVRDDNVTVRVNADLRANGPLAAATLAGKLGITKSRYLKDIDILPINTPGKPAPAPPAAAPAGADNGGSIGVNVPPIKDWKFNLDIRTDDPFLVRGNLARGQAVADLHLRGTGAQPLLDGNVEVQNLVASLPFSRLEIAEGNITFSPDQPLNPVLDLTGTSTIRNYLVTVYITGRAKDPKVQFLSDPPLAQEQIVSLLATGSTTDELAGNTEALAGKATLLVLQDLYRRTFKKKTSARDEPKATLADRVNLDVGATDPATGKQEVSAGFKVTDTVQFVADLGIQGDLRGRLKYLIRFR